MHPEAMRSVMVQPSGDKKAKWSRPPCVYRFVVGQWSGKQITLGLITTALIEQHELLLGFHTLSNHLEFQRMSHGDNSIHDNSTARICRYLCDEGFVDFEGIYGEALEITQA